MYIKTKLTFANDLQSDLDSQSHISKNTTKTSLQHYKAAKQMEPPLNFKKREKRFTVCTPGVYKYGRLKHQLHVWDQMGWVAPPRSLSRENWQEL